MISIYVKEARTHDAIIVHTRRLKWTRLFLQGILPSHPQTTITTMAAAAAAAELSLRLHCFFVLRLFLSFRIGRTTKTIFYLLHYLCFGLGTTCRNDQVVALLNAWCSGWNSCHFSKSSDLCRCFVFRRATTTRNLSKSACLRGASLPELQSFPGAWLYRKRRSLLPDFPLASLSLIMGFIKWRTLPWT